MKNLSDVLTAIGFSKTLNVRGRRSIADLFTPKKRCGLYVLHFSDSELYTGQAVDVTRRYVQHLDNHEDIVAISFRPIPKSRLNEEERNTIWTLEQNGFRLRNIAFTSVLSGETDFDLVMPISEQEKWLEVFSSADLNGQRTNDSELRKKYRRKYQQLLHEPAIDEVIGVMRKYVQTCIPVPIESELSFWAASCLPSYSAPGVKVYSRININWQEVFTVLRSEDGVNFSWHLAVSPLEQLSDDEESELFRKYPSLVTTDHFYEPGGHDQIHMISGNISEVVSFMSEEWFVRSARIFNMRLMRRGPCVFNRYHCFDLVDKLLNMEPGK